MYENYFKKGGNMNITSWWFNYREELFQVILKHRLIIHL